MTGDAPERAFRRVEYDKATKRARVLFCREPKPGAEEVEYVRADVSAAMVAAAIADALRAEPQSEYYPEAWGYLTGPRGSKLPQHAKDILIDLAFELAKYRALSDASARAALEALLAEERRKVASHIGGLLDHLQASIAAGDGPGVLAVKVQNIRAAAALLDKTEGEG